MCELCRINGQWVCCVGLIEVGQACPSCGYTEAEDEIGFEVWKLRDGGPLLPTPEERIALMVELHGPRP